MKYIIVHGSPIEGLEFIGPFESEAAAAAHGNTDGDIDGPWWIAALEAPERD